ncbi:MAG: hypothetical protein LBJ67_06500 [Planctomycetaceae bacterium]|jgi:hypothetical protein|nr:hypothetical protein [Planctomycetaceae bacterium]
MKLNITTLAFWNAVILIPAFSGCGCTLPSDLPKLYPTTIKIIQDGQELSDASVTIMPVDGSAWYASAKTDTQGNATLLTQGQYPGTATGKYKVTVSKREITQSKITIPDPNTDPTGHVKALEQANKEALEFNLVDLKYSSANTTPEEIEITSAKNEKTIDVGKTVRIGVK